MLERLSKGYIRMLSWFASPQAHAVILAIFVLQAVFLAGFVRVGTPPDETNHIKHIQFYENNSLDPFFTNQAPTYNLGDKTREVDYLYHYGMSLVARVLPLPETSEIYIFRLLSVVIALGSFIVLIRVMKRLGVSMVGISLALLILTNLSMVLFLSSAVNNDALVWLGMSLGVLLLLRIWNRPTLIDLLSLAVLSIGGGLVKRTLLPIGVFFGLTALVLIRRRLGFLLSEWRRPNWRIVALSLLLVVSIGLFSERVIGNVLRYGAVQPTCTQVQGEAACYDFWAEHRERRLSKMTPDEPMPLAEYVARWAGENVSNLLDIQTQGWRHTVKPPNWLAPLLGYMLLFGIGVGIVRDSRLHTMHNRQALQRLLVLALSIFFILTHLLVNYGFYTSTGFFGIALNGRYILPSIMLLVPLVVLYWTYALRRWPHVQAVLAIGVVLVTIAGSGLWLLLQNTQSYTG